ncbi:hypothetical protein, partial [Pseudomonas putida]|uniref:hypothetical protein n=1 Tax=Pseudomonas putida TaxID=303 RepID=UPI001CB8D470
SQAVGRNQLNGELNGQSHDELHHFLGHDHLLGITLQFASIYAHALATSKCNVSPEYLHYCRRQP